MTTASVSPSKRIRPEAAAANNRPASSVTTANSSSVGTPSATSVATFRNAACSSATLPDTAYWLPRR